MAGKILRQDMCIVFKVRDLKKKVINMGNDLNLLLLQYLQFFL
jgi:hypothetical protein